MWVWVWVRVSVLSAANRCQTHAPPDYGSGSGYSTGSVSVSGSISCSGSGSGSGVLCVFLLLFWIFVILIYSFGDVLLKFYHPNGAHSGNWCTATRAERGTGDRNGNGRTWRHYSVLQLLPIWHPQWNWKPKEHIHRHICMCCGSLHRNCKWIEWIIGWMKRKCIN